MIHEDLNIGNVMEIEMESMATNGSSVEVVPTKQYLNKSFGQPADGVDLSQEDDGFRPAVEPARSTNLITPKIFVMVISFLYGLYGICTLAILIYQKDILKLDPQVVQMISGVISFPFAAKPIFGYMCDKIIAKTGSIKYTVFVTACVRIVVYFLLSRIPPSVYYFYPLIFVSGLCNLFDNIMCEYTLVLTTKMENEKKNIAFNEQMKSNSADSIESLGLDDKSSEIHTNNNLTNGNGNAESVSARAENGLSKKEVENGNDLPIFFGFVAAGSLVGNFFGGRLIDAGSVNDVFKIANFFPLVTIAMCFLYQEQTTRTVTHKRTIKEEFRMVKQLLAHDNVLKMIVFIVVLNSSPNLEALCNYFLMDILNFTTTKLANMTTAGTFCYIVALILYYYFLKGINPRKFYLATNFIIFCLSSNFLLVVYGIVTKLGWDEYRFCMFNNGIYCLIAELNFMPVLAIWCSFCPKNLEATSITLFTGLMNLATGIGNYSGAFLTWAVGVNRNNIERVWLPITLQWAYYGLAALAVSLVKFPDPRDSKTAKANSVGELETITRGPIDDEVA